MLRRVSSFRGLLRPNRAMPRLRQYATDTTQTSRWQKLRRKEGVDQQELDLTSMKAVINKIIYHNEGNSYSVLAVSPKEALTQEVTVIGNFVSPTEGEHVEIQGGSWQYRGNDAQILAHKILPVNPTTITETELYLSKFFKGIGKKRAKAIVDMFGVKVFDVIENNPSALLKVSGLGSKKLESVIQPYLERVSARELVDFLVKYEVTSDHGLIIWKKFGEEAIETIQNNPYKLHQEIRAYTFAQSDELARKLGILPTSPTRVAAGARHVLVVGAVRNGHCVLPLPYLLSECGRLLDLPPFTIYEILLEEMRAEEPALVILPQTRLDFGDTYTYDAVNFFLTDEEATSFIAKREVHEQEVGIAQDIKRLTSSDVSHPLADILAEKGEDATLAGVLDGLSESQAEVLKLATKEKLLIVTGGPGVGKTATVTRIMKLFEEHGLSVLVSAPTGRAAVRLQELSGIPACTVHRLLGSSPGFNFSRNEEDPLRCDLLVVDEFSMMDLNLTAALFKAVPTNALVVIVGDPDQLPSVGPGNILKDIISSRVCTTHHLSEVFRQKEASDIIKAAHIINSGNLPDLHHTIPMKSSQISPLTSDFCFVEASHPNIILNTINSLVSYVLPQYGFTSEQIQILTPLNKNELGARNLNFNLQQQLNPYRSDRMEMSHHGITFRVGDRVMQISNNYDKDIYNGEMGKITEITRVVADGKAKSKRKADGWSVKVQFDRQTEEAEYSEGEMEQLLLSYAVTIHKSQGNEFPVTIIPLHHQHKRMLQRNLIYTAVTRGKRLVIVVGDKATLQSAVETTNSQGMARFTNLTTTLKNHRDPE